MTVWNDFANAEDVSPQNSEPQPLSVSVQAPQSGVTEPAGAHHPLLVSFSGSAVDGVAIVIPIPAGGNYDIPNPPGAAAVEYKANWSGFVYNGTTMPTGDYAVVWMPGTNGNVASDFTFAYWFTNGTTPDGAKETIKAYILEARDIVNKNPGRIVPGGKSAESAEVELIATAKESWAVTKTITDPAAAGDQLFSALRARSYSDVVLGKDNLHRITYQLKLAGSAKAGDYGRLLMKRIAIRDELSGFLPGGAPVSIDVNEGGVPISANISGTGQTRTIEFDVPNVNPSAFSADRTFEVSVVFKKDDYTNMLKQNPILQAPHPIKNSAVAIREPVTGGTFVQNTSSVAEAAFGWSQAEATMPSLTIEKYLSVSGTTRPYTTQLANRYEGAAYVDGDDSVVKFALQPVDPNNHNNHIGPPIVQSLKLQSGNARAVFSAGSIPSGTYLLMETVPINGDIPVNNPAVVVVSDPDPNTGISTITVDKVDYTSGNSYIVTNTATGVGRIRAHAEKQERFQYPAAYTDFPDVILGLYDGTNLIATGAAVNPSGELWFENVPLAPKNGGYTVAHVDHPAGLLDGYLQPASVPVTVSATVAGDANLRYNRDAGGFKMGKLFINPDDTVASVSNWSASFEIYDSVGNAPALPNGQGAFTIRSTGVSHIPIELPQGDYVLKETGLTIAGITNAASDYELNAGNDIKIHITAGDFSAIPTGPANKVNSSGQILNRSLYGQLAIQNFDFDGTGLEGDFTVTPVSGGSPMNVKVPAGGTAFLFVPAGAYDVKAVNLAAGNVIIASASDSSKMSDSDTARVTIAAKKTAIANAAVSIDPMYGAVGINWVGSQQVAAFVQAKLPNLNTWKVRADDTSILVANATFALYRLDSNGDYVDTGKRATTDSTGRISFESLKMGEYALVEALVPLGFSAPAYRAFFYDSATSSLKSAVSKASLPPGIGLPIANIDMLDYEKAASPPQTVGAAEAYITNMPVLTLRGYGVDAQKNTTFSGAIFSLYDTKNNVLGVARGTNGIFYDANGKEVYLSPGNSYHVIETGLTNGKYVENNDRVGFAFDQDGKLIKPTWTPPVPTPNSKAQYNAGTNQLVLHFGHVPKPSVSFVKLGETNEWGTSNGAVADRETTRISGATFILYRTDDDTENGPNKRYMLVDASGDVTGETDDETKATQIISGLNGAIKINDLDPTKTYFLKEVSAPSVPGDKNGMPYTFAKTTKLTFALNPADSASYIAIVDKVAVRPGGDPYPIVNTIESHYIRINKLPITTDGNGNVTGLDLAPGETVSNLKVKDAKFHVWAYDASAPDGKGHDYGEISTGTDRLEGSNTAVTSQLPPGKYIVEEIASAIDYGPLDKTSAGGILPGNETTTVYVNDNFDENLPQNGWTAANNHLAIVEIPDGSAPIKDITFGNSNRDIGAGYGSNRGIRFYGDKDGYVIDRNGGVAPVGPIVGVEFDIYPAYKTSAGSYIRLQTKDGKPLMSVTTKSVWANGSEELGRFLSPYIDVTGVFYKNDLPGVSAPAPTTPSAIWTGNSGTEIIDWDAAHAAGIPVDEIYNIMDNWSFILVEKGPLPPEYGSILPGAEPEFGFTATDKGTMWSVTDMIQLTNTRGAGNLRINKNSLDSPGTSLSGAKFDLYRADPANPNDTDAAIFMSSLETAGNDGSVREKVQPGYYYLKEVEAPAGYNSYGQYSISAGSQNVPFGSGEFIGPVMIDNDPVGETVVVVSDKEKANLTLGNFWNGYEFDRTDYIATYELDHNGVKARNIDVTKKSAVLTGLTDGDYTLRLMGVSTPLDEYIPNALASASPDYITFKVANGVVDAGSMRAGGTPLGGSPLPAEDIWYSGNVLNVNHPAKGALIIRKGAVASDGEMYDFPVGPPSVASTTLSEAATLTQAAFTYEKKNGAGWDAPVNIEWKQADHVPSGLRVLLTPGIYRIGERKAGTSPGWAVDESRSYYIEITAGQGVVYMSNGMSENEAAPERNSTSASPKAFYNEYKQGLMEVKKLAQKGDTVNLTDAAFELYPAAANGNTPAGSKVADITWDAARQGYFTVVPEGHYVVKETKAPAGYGLRDGYFPVEVKRATKPSWNSYGDANAVNTLAVLDPSALIFKVAKETTFAAIRDASGNIVTPARTERIPLLPISVYKRIDAAESGAVSWNGGYWKEVSGTVTAPASGNGQELGVAAHEITATGEYRVVEKDFTNTHSYLSANPDYRYDDGVGAQNPLGTGKSIFVEYDEANNRFYVNNANGNPDWNTANADMLTVNNPFRGFRFAALKRDFNTGGPISGAEFALYASYDDAKKGVNEIGNQKIMTGSDGLAVFAPMWQADTGSGATYWIREIKPPAGYLIDPWYDEAIKPVTAAKSGGGNVLTAEFRDGTPDKPSLTLAKDVKAGAPGSASNMVSLPLGRQGFDTSFTVHTDELKNTMPLRDFKVSDKGLVFKGSSGGQTVEIGGAAGNAPSYRIDAVRIQRSESWLTAEDALNGVAKAPVWAKVNNEAWKLLDREQAWSLSGAPQTFEITYSATNPNAQGFDATDTWVGAGFAPGDIEADVSIDRFTPSKIQPEVSEIVNTVEADAKSGTSALTKEAAARIDIPTQPRPVMTLKNERIGNNPLNVGDNIKYRVTLTNSDATHSIAHPIIIDHMETDVLSMGYDANLDPIYTVSGPGGTAPAVNFTDMRSQGDFVKWEFPSLVLAPQESVTVEFEGTLARIIAGDTVSNEAFGTSGAAPLISDTHKTGATFVADDMNAPYAIYDASGLAARQAIYDALIAAVPSANLADYGLFVRAAVDKLPIARSGGVNIEKSVKTDSMSGWTSSAHEISIRPDETLHYRLRIQNNYADSSSGLLSKLRIVDELPHIGDQMYVGKTVRGTEWNDEFRGYWKADNLKISTIIAANAPQQGDFEVRSSTQTAATPSDWLDRPAGTLGTIGALGFAPDAKSFAINFGAAQEQQGSNYMLQAHDVLVVEFDLKLDLANIDSATLGKLMEDNALKIASNTFVATWQTEKLGYTPGNPIFLESNRISAKLTVPEKPKDLPGTKPDEPGGSPDSKTDTPIANPPKEPSDGAAAPTKPAPGAIARNRLPGSAPNLLPDPENPKERDEGDPQIKLPESKMSAAEDNSTAIWSLLSLLLSLIALLITLTLLITAFIRRRMDEDEGKYERDERDERMRKGWLLRIFTAVTGLLVGIVFLIVDDLSLPMDWINRWTIYVGIVFIVHILLLAIYLYRHRAEEDEEEPDPNRTA
ncbi:MAG: prealbumin-like fold domain-containing protein [Clostridiales Family XIII bacterium]|nr:prealbumin-like fold domain-containing protein [Clostridiales Family XIII bacterium]